MWTGYPPCSTITTGNTALYTFTVLVLGFTSIIGGVVSPDHGRPKHAGAGSGSPLNKLNIFCRVHARRLRLQLIFVRCWAPAVTLISDGQVPRHHFFDPSKGGDVLTYQNLFWFYCPGGVM